MKAEGIKINFVLREIDKIVPFGQNRDYLSWFGLTDADLWIDAGERTIYEYSDAARKFWNHDIRYNDYQLSRFLEDFSEIFGAVSESVPEKLYDIAEELNELFYRWKESHFDDDDDVFDVFFDEEYEPLTEWFYDRVFDSGHLVGGPLIGCFRCGDRVKLWWYGDHLLESGESIWTAPEGVFEMAYGDFVSEVRRFFGEFYAKMDEQVQKALEKEWRGVELDKENLVRENRERREGFEREIALLDGDIPKTDWDKILALYEKMQTAFGA